MTICGGCVNMPKPKITNKNSYRMLKKNEANNKVKPIK